MRRIIFEPTQIKCFITCGPVRDLILNSRDVAFLLHSNVWGCVLAHTGTLDFFNLIIYLRWHHIKEDSCSISSTTNDSGSSSSIHFVLLHCAGKIYIRPTIHLAVHEILCCALPTTVMYVFVSINYLS